MARFYYCPIKEGGVVVIEGGDAHHIRNVLRLREGDQISLWDGTGKEYLAIITEESRGRITAKIENCIKRQQRPAIQLILAQALPKGAKLDLVIQKATELGVAKIMPFTCQRSIPRLSPDKEAAKINRWQRIAYEAAKQCGRLSLPQVEKIFTFSEILKYGQTTDLSLMFWEEEKELHLKDIFKYRQGDKILLVVGPEGGFAESEVTMARRHGFLSVTLGPRILRTETVALALLSIFQFEYGGLE